MNLVSNIATESFVNSVTKSTSFTDMLSSPTGDLSPTFLIDDITTQPNSSTFTETSTTPTFCVRCNSVANTSCVPGTEVVRKDACTETDLEASGDYCLQKRPSNSGHLDDAVSDPTTTLSDNGSDLFENVADISASTDGEQCSEPLASVEACRETIKDPQKVDHSTKNRVHKQTTTKEIFSQPVHLNSDEIPNKISNLVTSKEICTLSSHVTMEHVSTQIAMATVESNSTQTILVSFEETPTQTSFVNSKLISTQTQLCNSSDAYTQSHKVIAVGRNTQTLSATEEQKYTQTHFASFKETCNQTILVTVNHSQTQTLHLPNSDCKVGSDQEISVSVDKSTQAEVQSGEIVMYNSKFVNIRHYNI